MKVVVAPDSFGGTLTAPEVAAAIAEGWREVRPRDELVLVPMSDGGEGLLDVLATADDTWVSTEVSGPLGHPVEAALLLRPDHTAVVEAARACGLALVPEGRRSPLRATSYGVGQLLDAAVDVGARTVLLGLGGSATVDGGAGALTALGYRIRTDDGSGLKVGGDDLHRVDRIERGWSVDPSRLVLQLLADVSTTLGDAARVFGPQKGASADDVVVLERGLRTWADVVGRDLPARPDLEREAGSGAAGGLGFGLAAAFGGPLVSGAERVGELVGLPTELDDAEVVVTGEGRLDATTVAGKVVSHVAALARARGVRALAVAGQALEVPAALDAVELSGPDGPGPDPAADVRTAAARLARRI